MLFGYNGSLKHDCEDVEKAVTREIMRTARRLRLNKQGPVIAGKDSLIQEYSFQLQLIFFSPLTLTLLAFPSMFMCGVYTLPTFHSN